MNLLSRFSSRTWMIVGLIILAIGIIFLLLRGETVYPAYTSQPLVPRNYGDVVEVNGKLRFFNGRAFVDYDPTSGSTSPLLDELRYPPVKDVQWNEQGSKALITSVFHSADDTFGKRLRAARQSLQAQYHWVVDIGAGTIAQLPEYVERAQWNGDWIVGSSRGGGEETTETTHLFTINPQTGSAKSLASVPNLHKIVSSSSQDVYVLRRERDEYIVSRLSQDVLQDLYRSSNDTPIVSPDGKYIAVIESLAVKDESNSVPPAIVRLIASDTGEEMKKITGYSQDALVRFISTSRLAIVDIAKEPRILHYDIPSNDLKTYAPAKEQPALGLAIDVKSFGNDMITLTTSSLQFISLDPLSIHTPALNYNQSSLSGDGFLVVKKENGTMIQSLTVNVYKPPVATRYRNALELIRQQGLNPDLFDIITDTSYLSD